MTHNIMHTSHIDKDTWQRLETRAADEGRSVDEMLNRMLDEAESGYEAGHKTDTRSDRKRSLSHKAVLRALSKAATLMTEHEDWQSQIDQVLGWLGNATGMSRVYLFKTQQDRHGNQFVSQWAEWAAPGVSPQLENPHLQSVSMHDNGFERWGRLLSQNQPIFGNVRDFPRSEQALLLSQEVESLAVMPIFVHGAWWGFVGFDVCHKTHTWTQAELDLLHTIAKLLAVPIQRESDVDALRTAQAALQRQNERQDAILRAMPDILFRNRRDGTILEYHSPDMDSLYVPPEDFLGKRSSEVMPPELGQRLEVYYRQVADTQQPAQLEYQLPIQGEQRDYEVRMVPVNRDEVLSIVRDVTEQKRTEAALRDSEEKYRLIAENTSDGIFILDGQTETIIYASPAYDRQWGREPAESVGKEADDLYVMIHPDDRDTVFQQVREAIARQETDLSYIYRARHVDGTYHWKEDNTHLTYAPDGTYQRAYVVSRDVTARKEAEDALRRSEARLRSLLDSQTTFVVRTDMNGDYTYTNERFNKKYGWIYDGEPLGKPVYPSVIPADHDKMYRAVMDCMASPGKPVQALLRKPKQDGGIFWTIWEFTAVGDQPDEVSEIQCMGFDITDFMESQEELRVKDQALMAASNAIVITDLDGNIQWANAAFTTLTGYTQREAIGKNPRDLVKSGYQSQAYYKDMWDTILSGDIWCGRLVNKRKDGTLYTEEQTITPVNDETGKLTHFIAIKQDVTERERTEQLQLEHTRLQTLFQREKEQNSLIQRTISQLSHDLRTPLTVISTSQHMLRDYFHKLSEAKRKEKLDMIGRQLDYAVRLIDDVVGMVKNNLSEHVFSPAPVNMASLAKLSIQEIQAASENEREITLENHMAQEVVAVDETLVSRILLNLLSNAIKYSPDDSHITVRLNQDDDSVTCTVTDEGVGISEADRERIFEAFYRTEDARHVNGTGLGLSIVSQCVELHNGSIDVYSQPRQGTSFVVRLPVGENGAQSS